MASFSFNGNPIMSDELFNEMVSCDEGIYKANCAHGYCDKYGKRKGIYVNYPSFLDVHDLTEKQVAIAKEIFKKRKDEQLLVANQPGTLTFVTMGMDFPPKIEGGLGNYRIRAKFLDKNGHEWFIEIHPHYAPTKKLSGDESLGFYGEIVDTQRNREEQEQSNREFEAVKAKYGNKFIPFDERPKMAEYHYEHFETDLHFTDKGVLYFINKRFGTNYQRLYLDRYFINCDDVVSRDR